MLSPDTKAQLQRWIDEKNHNKILNFVELILEQRDRAELQARAYLHQITIVRERTQEVIRPLLTLETTRAPTKTQIQPKPVEPARPLPSLGITLKL